MALRDLVEADCGGSNSLVRLTSHFTSDHALKDEGLRHPFTHGEGFGDSDQLVQQFLESTLGHSPQTFRMDSLLQEMREMEQAVLAPVASPGVAELTASDPQAREWVDQYLGAGKNFDHTPSTEDIWSDTQRDPGKEVSELGLGPLWAQEYIEASEQIQEETPQLAELSDLSTEWTENEDKIILEDNVDGDVLCTVSDPKAPHSKFMKFMRSPTEESEATDINNQAEAWTKEFEETLPWEEQFQSKMSAIERPGPSSSLEALETPKSPPPAPALEDAENPFTNQFWEKLQESWNKLDQEHSWLSDFNEYTDPFKEYTFEKENPMKDNKDALEEGKKRLAEGDIPSAVLCFEAAAQADPENALAWQLLGCTQAENEQDPLAIAALKRCLALDPENLTALMAIAVSFSNENYQNQACHALKEWLRVNPKYSDLVPDTGDFKNMMGAISSLLPSGLHQQVKNFYIDAARRSPSDGIDPDVQCGLGVLFHLTDEYDKAVDCFKAALQVRPNDFRMWNRLGATLANGNRSEEAVDAYHHALQLFPGFIRARYNLGICCVNLGAHKEAAEHLLTALNQQAAGRGAHGERAATMSDTIWSTLKLVAALMERHDLYPAIDDRDLERLNKEFSMD